MKHKTLLIIVLIILVIAAGAGISGCWASNRSINRAW